MIAFVVGRQELRPHRAAVGLEIDDQGLAGHPGPGHDFESSPPGVVLRVLLQVRRCRSRADPRSCRGSGQDPNRSWRSSVG